VFGRRGVRHLEAGGPVIGLLEFAPYEQGQETLDPGDVLVVFSDGVSEALDKAGEEFGEERLQAAVEAVRDQPAAVIVEELVGAVQAFSRGAAQSDDITAMVLRYLGDGA
jgi:sigma-B regulation protein RsbU (phosphoserine phosphatase)